MHGALGCATANADSGVGVWRDDVLLEFVVPPGNQPHPSKIIDIEMLFFPGGRERMEQEWRDLFAGAGFRLTRIVPTKSPFSVIEAEVA